MPWLANLSLPLDAVEALLWGREWQMGYDKHPPLSAWTAEIAGLLSGRSDLAIYALSQVCEAVAALAMWRLARDIVDEGRAALATLLLLVGVYYMHFTSPEFNVNVLQLPLWALLFLCFWRAVRTAGLAALAAWTGVGICFGLAMLSKYLAVFAIPALALFVVFTPTGRRTLRTPGPYLAGLVAAIIFLPHFLWMLDTDFVTLRYGMRRSSAGETAWFDHLTHPMKFVIAQMLAGLAALVVLVLSGGRLPGSKNQARESAEIRDSRVFVWLIALAPVLAMAAYSLVTGARLRSMWGTPMLLAAPLWLTMTASFDMRPRHVPIFAAAWCVLFAAAPIGYYIDHAVGPSLTHDAKRTNYPGRELALRIEREWNDRVSHQPLIAVIGDVFYGGLVSWYGDERALVYIEGSTDRTFWVEDSDVDIFGAMVVWKIGMADRPDETDRSFFDQLRVRFPSMVELEPITLTPRLRGPFGGPIEGASEILGLGFIPPSPPPAQ